MPQSDITVAILTRDPYFLFAARSLLGRDRRTRLVPELVVEDLSTLRDHLSARPYRVLIIDLDSFPMTAFYGELVTFAISKPDVRILCLAESCLPKLPVALFHSSIRAILAKSDLVHALHIAVHVMVDTTEHWITQKVLERSSQLAVSQKYRVVKSEQSYPGLSEPLAKVVRLRVIIGLDNPDIDDELAFASGTAKTNMKRAYKVFKISGRDPDKSMEFRCFEKLSEWWRKQRFEDA